MRVAGIDWTTISAGFLNMDVLQKSVEFHQFLDSLLTVQDCTQDVFSGEYKASGLVAGTTTPFSAFVGQKNDRATVVISKHVPVTGSMNAEQVEVKGLELLANLSCACGKEVDDPLPVISQQVVSVGQSLESSRVYLTHSSPFYEGWSGAVVQTRTFAGDRGLAPLPLSSARFIASLYCLGHWKAKGILPDVWVLCERNQGSIIALGCRSNGQASPCSIFTLKEGDIASDANPVTDNAKLLTGTVFSEYDIMNSSFDEEIQSGEFRIKFAWTDPDGMLSSPPESSDAILQVSSVPGDQFSPVLVMYEELHSLYRLCSVLNGGMEWQTGDCEDSEGVLTLGHKTAREVDSFIQDMAHPLTKPADITVTSPTTDHMIYEPRTDLDFTERLWLFCRDVRSFEELQIVFAEVFKALLLGKIQPFVHRKSTSTLALLLRQVLLSPGETLLQETALKFQLLLTEARLLPCLVQLGIEKMQRDYRSFFVGTDICPAKQFDRFFSPTSCSPLVQCLELCRVHSILELNASIMKILRLPNTALLSTFTKAAMEVLMADPHFQCLGPTPVFSLPLPAYSPVLKSVVAMCSKLSPAVWCLTSEQRMGDGQGNRNGKERTEHGMSGQNRSGKERVVYLLRNQPLFRYLSGDTDVYLHKCYCETN